SRRRAVAFDEAVALLEDERGGERERLFRYVVVGEVSREDQHALRVNRAAQLDLALDVDDAPGAEADARGDTARPRKGEAAELNHRQRVHLTDDPARGRNRECAARHRILDALARTARSVDPRVDGLLHV